MGSVRRLAIAALFAAAPSAAAESILFSELDANKDGVVDLAEVQAAASAAFARAMEASPSELVSKEKQDRFRQKFQAAVERWFKLADVDGDGKLDEKELEGPAGQKLEKAALEIALRAAGELVVRTSRIRRIEPMRPVVPKGGRRAAVSDKDRGRPILRQRNQYTRCRSRFEPISEGPT